MSLTIQFIPHHDFDRLSSLGKIKKLLKLAREDKIVMLEGRLRKEEEAELIKTTMEEIDDEFKGIEIAVIYPNASKGDIVRRLRDGLANLLLGDRVGLTIIGPANVVREIKKDPNKVMLFTKDQKKRSKRKR